jgi:hypothetical protein
MFSQPGGLWAICKPSTGVRRLLAAPATGAIHCSKPKRVWMRRLISFGDQPPTGEPSARNWPARFGGRGDLIRRPYPYLFGLPLAKLVSCREFNSRGISPIHYAFSKARTIGKKRRCTASHGFWFSDSLQRLVVCSASLINSCIRGCA